MSPFALLNDLQNLDWLLHFALLIKCNVDAREIADKLSDAVSQRAGEIWFQEPMYNFAFFPTTAQELKYPLLDAYDLEKLRTRDKTTYTASHRRSFRKRLGNSQ